MDGKVKKCPGCGVAMKMGAKACPACGKKMPSVTVSVKKSAAVKDKKVMPKAKAPLVKAPKAKAYDDHDWD